MQENYERIQKGLRIFHPLLAGFVGMEMSKEYKTKWWDVVLYTLRDYENEIPTSGDYTELVDSLDVANCIRLI